MIDRSRRKFLKWAGAVVAAPSVVQCVGAHAAEAAQTMTFGFGTYGMQSLKTEQSIAELARIGYDAIELCVRPEWDASPVRMTPARRREVALMLGESKLKLTALMEHLQPSRDDKQHQQAVGRLKAAAELGKALSPQQPPVIQTTLGGGEWEAVKALYVDRLGDWVATCKAAGAVLAIKPHRGGAMSRPSEAVWLIEQSGQPRWLRMVYDYSHYAFRDMPLTETVRAAGPHIAHVAVKDAVRRDGRVVFQLPGQSGMFDYAELLRLLGRAGYAGDVCCEVSGMVSNKPDYDPTAAAEACYKNLTPAFERAGIKRG